MPGFIAQSPATEGSEVERRVIRHLFDLPRTGDKISKEKCLFSGNGDERWPIRFQLNAAIRTHPIGTYVQTAQRLPGGTGKENFGLRAWICVPRITPPTFDLAKVGEQFCNFRLLSNDFAARNGEPSNLSCHRERRRNGRRFTAE